MKKLTDLFEGILDIDYTDDSLDKNVISDFGEWMLKYWKGTKWQEGGTLDDPYCWYDVVPWNATYIKYVDFCDEAKKRGKKCTVTHDDVARAKQNKENVTIIYVSHFKHVRGPKSESMRRIDIGNPAKDDALFLTTGYCPHGAKMADAEERVVMWCPDVMGSKGTHKNLELAVDSMGNYKGYYYIIPGHYWEKIKNTIIWNR